MEVMMLKITRLVAVLLLVVGFVLTGCSSVTRPISQAETYAWSYVSAGNPNEKPVCKKIQVTIFRDRRQGTNFDSNIVPDKFCAKLAKPISSPASR